MSSLNHFGGRKPGRSPFDAIRHVEEGADGKEFEYWSAREAMSPLGYVRWENMENVLRKARAACRNSGHAPEDHFRDVTKMVSLGSGAGRPILDVQMTRLGMYLLAMNGDPDKAEIAAAQAYFTIQTRRAELFLPEPTAAPTPAPLPPWAARFRESFAPHSQFVLSQFPAGSFTVITEGVMTMLMLEDELIRHMMEVRPGDRPCISIGLTWSHYRKNHLGKRECVGEAPIWLPDRGMEVPVKVYEGGELHLFKTWLHFTYLAEKLQPYLDNKPEFKAYGSLPRASVADNTCRTITGRPASLAQPLRRLIAANNGFVPAPRPLPPRRPPSLGA